MDFENKRDDFFQNNFEKRYFPVLRDLLGEEGPKKHLRQTDKSPTAMDLPSSLRLPSLQSPSSDYESCDFEDRSNLDSSPSDPPPTNLVDPEVDEGVECAASYTLFMREFLRESVTVDAVRAGEDVVNLVERSVLEDVVVCSTSPSSATQLASSTPIATPTHLPNRDVDSTQSSCFLFEINMDALPRCLSPSKDEDDSRHDDSHSQEGSPDVSCSSNSVCEGPIEILSFEVEQETMSHLTRNSVTSASAAASPRVLVATSCDLNPVEAELEIAFISTSNDDDSDYDDSEVDDDDDDDDDEEDVEEVVNDANKEESGVGEVDTKEECKKYSISVLDILNGSQIVRQRRISEQSLESVDWSESDNDDSQV